MTHKIVSQKIQSVLCPLLASVLVNYQNILKNTCKNRCYNPHKHWISGGVGRKESRPIQGIDTHMFFCTHITEHTP